MSWKLMSTATERSPVDLYHACASQDDDAIAEFVRRYQPELSNYARRHNADDPEGIADLATFETVRRLADMRRLDEPAVRAYLYRALKGRLIDERRKRIPLVSIDGEAVELTAEGPESPVLGQLGFTEMLDMLTPAEREVVSHRFVAGYTSVETAAKVGRSPDAVRRLQSNALARLRLALAVAVVAAAIGTGYWLLARSPAVRTTEPIDGPTQQLTPDPAPESMRSVSTMGSTAVESTTPSRTDRSSADPAASSAPSTTAGPDASSSSTSSGSSSTTNSAGTEGSLVPPASSAGAGQADGNPAGRAPATAVPSTQPSGGGAQPTTPTTSGAAGPPPTAGPTTTPSTTNASTTTPSTTNASTTTTTPSTTTTEGGRRGRGNGRGPGDGGGPGNRGGGRDGRGDGNGPPGRDGENRPNPNGRPGRGGDRPGPPGRP